ncbi:MAG: permease-like cell division protein FtsX [Bacillota bacterium]|nr:permease-like cell division protein FtsX [Bacillota bacterium]
MKASSFRYVFPQATKSMLQNGWMTFAAIMTITISLFLCAFFWLLLVNLNANAERIESDVRVVAYLAQEVTEAELPEIEKQIKWIDGVAELEFTDKLEGLSELEERFGGVDLQATLGGANPLPFRYSITAESTEQVAAIAEELQTIAGVDTVRYGQDTVEKLFALTATLRQVGLAIMALLGVAAVVLIAMAIRMTIMARRKEIMVMKWVGATNGFIRWPFFIEGLILGVAGAVVALTLVLITYNSAASYIHSAVSFVTILSLSEIWLTATAFTLGAGLILGALGAVIPLTRFMDV